MLNVRVPFRLRLVTEMIPAELGFNAASKVTFPPRSTVPPLPLNVPAEPTMVSDEIFWVLALTFMKPALASTTGVPVVPLKTLFTPAVTASVPWLTVVWPV